MANDPHEILPQIFRLVLDLDDSADPTMARRINEPKWDSLANATLVAALESEFNVTLDASEIERLTSYQATLLLVQEKLG